MKRLLAAGAVGLLLAGGSLVGAQADPGDNNKHGLCTAYFNGQKTGWGKNGTPGPFAALEAEAEEADQTMYEFCSQFGIGGNPDHGRFPECFDNDDNTGNEACPSE